MCSKIDIKKINLHIRRQQKKVKRCERLNTFQVLGKAALATRSINTKQLQQSSPKLTTGTTRGLVPHDLRGLGGSWLFSMSNIVEQDHSVIYRQAKESESQS